jgi:hypothetical protein
MFSVGDQVTIGEPFTSMAPGPQTIVAIGTNAADGSTFIELAGVPTAFDPSYLTKVS